MKGLYQSFLATTLTLALAGSMSGHDNQLKRTYSFGDIAGMASHAAHVRSLPARSPTLADRIDAMALASSSAYFTEMHESE